MISVFSPFQTFINPSIIAYTSGSKKAVHDATNRYSRELVFLDQSHMMLTFNSQRPLEPYGFVSSASVSGLYWRILLTGRWVWLAECCKTHLKLLQACSICQGKNFAPYDSTLSGKNSSFINSRLARFRRLNESLWKNRSCTGNQHTLENASVCSKLQKPHEKLVACFCFQTANSTNPPRLR